MQAVVGLQVAVDTVERIFARRVAATTNAAVLNSSAATDGMYIWFSNEFVSGLLLKS